MSTQAQPSGASQEQHARGGFTSRKVFILAAIGSAVGLGNIWRFPYVAYENGGGAFVIPYLVALLVAGLPFLLLDYGIGHRYRGSAPLSFRRLGGATAETLGWWQVGICAVIAIYYAVIIAWAVRYTFFSIDKSWGSKPDEFFFGEFLQVAAPGIGLDFVGGVLWPLLLVWVAVIAVMVAGCPEGHRRALGGVHPAAGHRLPRARGSVALPAGSRGRTRMRSSPRTGAHSPTPGSGRRRSARSSSRCRSASGS